MNKLAILEFTNILQTHKNYNQEDILNELIKKRYCKAFLHHCNTDTNNHIIECDAFEISLKWNDKSPCYIDIYDIDTQERIFKGRYFNYVFIIDLLNSIYYKELSKSFDFVNSDMDNVKKILREL